MSFLRTDGGKIAMVIAVFVIAGGVFYFTGGGKSNTLLKGAIEFICVETGETFHLARTKQPMQLPVENPKTGKRTLLPCFERDGVRQVSRRQRGELKELGDLNQYVDYETLQIRSEPE